MLGAMFVLVGCSAPVDPVPPATPEMAEALGVEEAQLVRGRAAYMENCNRCHERVPPGELDPEYWRGIIPHMAKNAKLSSSEQTDVLVYLMAAHGTVHDLDLE